MALSNPIARGSVNWRVEGFFETTERVYSPEFEIGVGDNTKTRWKLWVQRKLENSEDQVSVYLKTLENGEVKANFNLTIFKYNWDTDYSKSQLVTLDERNLERGRIFNSKLDNNFTSWGFEEFINTSTLESLIKNKVFVVGSKIEVFSFERKDRNVEKSLAVQSSSLETGLHEMFLNSDMTDVELKVKGESILCHKVVLSVRSKVFKAMFSNKDMLESQTNSVTIDNFSCKCMKTLLEFLYTNKFDNISPQLQDIELAWELCSAADYFELQELEKLCFQFLGENVNNESVLQILEFASKKNNADLTNKCLQFLATCKDLAKIKGYGDIDGKKCEFGFILDVCQYFGKKVNHSNSLAVISNEDCQ